jgi:hypothetical protein
VVGELQAGLGKKGGDSLHAGLFSSLIEFLKGARSG